MMLTTDNQTISRAPLQIFPYFALVAEVFIRAPIKSGDFGWLKANDRDISLIFSTRLV